MDSVEQRRCKQTNQQTGEEGSSTDRLRFDFVVAFALVLFARFVLPDEHLNGRARDHRLYNTGLVVLELARLVVVVFPVEVVELAGQDVRVVPRLGKHFRQNLHRNNIKQGTTRVQNQDGNTEPNLLWVAV